MYRQRNLHQYRARHYSLVRLEILRNQQVLYTRQHLVVLVVLSCNRRNPQDLVDRMHPLYRYTPQILECRRYPCNPLDLVLHNFRCSQQRLVVLAVLLRNLHNRQDLVGHTHLSYLNNQ